MQIISAAEVDSLLPFPRLIEHMRISHAGRPVQSEEIMMHEEEDQSRGKDFLVRAAWIPDQVMGVKLASIYSCNSPMINGLPGVQATYVLFAADSGSPLLIIDGNALTYKKTAADSALGADLLARGDCKRMLMVGAGAMAPHLILAHHSACPSLEHFQIWNRSQERGDQLLAHPLLQNLNLTLIHDLQKAVNDADLISCATMAREPLIRGEWLRPGTHLDLVGAYTPGMREADDVCLQRGRIYVDSRLTTKDIGELTIPLAAKAIAENAILGDLYDLCGNRVNGRDDDRQITIFKNGGGGHLDLMTAHCIYKQLQ